MVKIAIQEDKKLYQCEECGLHYEGKNKRKNTRHGVKNIIAVI